MTTWVISGLSGAGKATALAALEASGIACVDNLPLELLDAFLSRPRATGAAAVVDARQGEGVSSFVPKDGVSVLFLDARDDVLLRRNAESTRPHPRATAGGGIAAVRSERALLQAMRAAADVIIDTSELQSTDLQRRVRELVSSDTGESKRIQLTLSSFGYKFGPQAEADWVIDTRMVRNPFWVAELRPLTGLDDAVREYVMSDPAATQLVHRSQSLLSWACGRDAERGRRHVHVAVGCTGGRHRSVVIARELAAALETGDVAVSVRHRDVDKPDPR